eukprot:933328-Rhodomonas_salina.1
MVRDSQLAALLRVYIAASASAPPTDAPGQHTARRAVEWIGEAGSSVEAAMREAVMSSPEWVGLGLVESARKPWLMRTVDAMLAQHRRLAAWLRALPPRVPPRADPRKEEEDGEEDGEREEREREAREERVRGLVGALLSWKDVQEMVESYARARQHEPAQRAQTELTLDAKYGGWPGGGVGEREA